MIVVADTSVLLNLCCVGQIELLRSLFSEVAIPFEVVAEFERLASDIPRFRGLKIPTWVQQKQVSEISSSIRCTPGLDPGEAAALSLALEIQADAILVDERRGHEVALQLGLKTVGVLGILVQAKSAGLLVEVRPLIERLEQVAMFWMTPSLRAKILRLSGE